MSHKHRPNNHTQMCRHPYKTYQTYNRARQTSGQHMKTMPNRCTGREQGRGKGTRKIGSGHFGTFGTHIEDCEVLVSKEVGK